MTPSHTVTVTIILPLSLPVPHIYDGFSSEGRKTTLKHLLDDDETLYQVHVLPHPVRDRALWYTPHTVQQNLILTAL